MKRSVDLLLAGGLQKKLYHWFVSICVVQEWMVGVRWRIQHSTSNHNPLGSTYQPKFSNGQKKILNMQGIIPL